MAAHPTEHELTTDLKRIQKEAKEARAFGVSGVRKCLAWQTSSGMKIVFGSVVERMLLSVGVNVLSAFLEDSWGPKVLSVIDVSLDCTHRVLDHAGLIISKASWT